MTFICHGPDSAWKHDTLSIKDKNINLTLTLSIICFFPWIGQRRAEIQPLEFHPSEATYQISALVISTGQMTGVFWIYHFL